MQQIVDFVTKSLEMPVLINYLMAKWRNIVAKN